MSKQSLEEKAIDLAENFINGNISDAVNGVLKCRPKAKALTLARLVRESLDEASFDRREKQESPASHQGTFGSVTVA